VKELLASQFAVDPDSITMETDLVKDLGADSLDLVELLTMLEEEFGIVITDEAVYNYKTVAEITEFIEQTLGAMA
jgi:acyl carrier protein